ncbi:threonine/serine exporter family protein [Pararcticibacter amylolyticus]|uniref:Threonine/serine exporter n=1 Tax=Pararcticibacter amylolyticus TaxID=2173175 RepID=A0A2U2PMH0_9SPHI|nr:threonine/serine exporter family protein [Pararcticibacter amylolyticus]PWG82504.1 threonine/serine exporter [Pararcticibacter amylolyticus]
MDWLLLEKCIWFGLAATGFAVLFNVPVKNLPAIYLMGAAGGFTKVFTMHLGTNIVFGSLYGATVVGFLSIYFAHRRHSPPPVLAIPAVIPMIPGILAYKMIIGLIKLAGEVQPDTYSQILSETVNNGLKVMFILMCLAGGVAIPMLITRKESAKELKFKRKG